MSGDGLAFASAAELARLYRTREVSPVEVARAVLDAIERWNPVLNVYCHLDREATLADARRSESRWLKGEPIGPADGVTFGVKDILLAKGAPTGYGSRAARKEQPSDDDAPSAARLREAGGVFLGKTTSSEFGWKGTADSPLTGITRNPWNPALTTGGSSGGAAAAAAAGLGNFQLGTDGGGSVRIPASFCGVCGIKATFGRVPMWPAGPMLMLSHVGPITRNVADLECMYRVVSQPDPRDWYAIPEPRSSLPRPTTLAGLRFGFFMGDAHCDPEVEEVARDAAAEISRLGGVVEETRLPIEGARDLIRIHWQAGAAWLVSQVPEDRREMMDAGLRESAAGGAALSLDAYYSAMVARQRFGEALHRHLARFDAVLSPTLPILPFTAGRTAPETAASQDWLDWNPFTYPFNLSRQPAVSIPAGFSRGGLPIGIQLAGRLYDDARLLAIAALVEKALAIPRRRPQLAGSRSAEGAIR